MISALVGNVLADYVEFAQSEPVRKVRAAARPALLVAKEHDMNRRTTVPILSVCAFALLATAPAFAD